MIGTLNSRLTAYYGADHVSKEELSSEYQLSYIIGSYQLC
jgi:hypothetical protein